MRKTLVFVALLAVAVGCSKKRDSAAPGDNYVFEPVRIACAYVPLVEKPDAKTALLVGDLAKSLTNFLSHAGVACSTTGGGRFDLIVVSCGGMSKASCGKLCASLADGGVVAWLMDATEVTAEEMLERFRSFDLPSVHLWMPGSDLWALVGRAAPAKVRLSDMLDVFAREGTFEDLARARCGTLPEMFANYTGTMDDVAPAFYNFKRDQTMCPELFVTREVPEIAWIDSADMDEDIRKSVLSEMRSMQVVRRLAVQGNIAASEAKDKKGEEQAADLFAKVTMRNPNDLLVLERLDRLNRNARAFLETGKILQAMKCFETMVLIRPTDAVAVHNFGMCLKKIGKTDLAKHILDRAEMLARRAEGLKALPNVTNAVNNAKDKAIEGKGARYLSR